MLVPAIIKALSDARDFEYTDMKGVKKQMTAVDVVLKSGNDEFVATAFDEPAKQLNSVAVVGDVALFDLRFTTRTKKREDGGNYTVQAVTVNTVDVIWQSNKPIY